MLIAILVVTYRVELMLDNGKSKSKTSESGMQRVTSVKGKQKSVTALASLVTSFINDLGYEKRE